MVPNQPKFKAPTPHTGDISKLHLPHAPYKRRTDACITY